MVTKGLFFQFSDIENFAQISSKKKKTAKLVNFTLEKTTFFQKTSQLLVEKLTKFAPKTH